MLSAEEAVKEVLEWIVFVTATAAAALPIIGSLTLSPGPMRGREDS